MIKKVFLLKIIENKFPTPVNIFKFDPPLYLEEESVTTEYIIGGFYKTVGYAMAAFYLSDEFGNILNNKPIIKEEGFNTYAEIFKNLGYTFI